MIVNKTNRENANFARAVESIQQVFGRRLRRFWSLELSLHRWYTKRGQVILLNSLGLVLL